MDRMGAKLWALAHSRCSTSLRLKSFSQPGSGAVMTTSHSSVMDVGQPFAVDQGGPSAIRQSVFVMSAALDHAVRSGRIRSNPARGLGLPRPKRRDYVYLTHGQVLVLATEAGRWRLLILLLAYTGRRGEATALRVRDIDFDRRRVDVSRAFSDVGGRIVLGTPKSHQSRTVPVPRFIAIQLAGAVDGKRSSI